MSIYQKMETIGLRFFKKHQLFKWGFNLSPMYRRSTARIVDISPDLYRVKIKLPISYKNKNYMNTIFGGSMFSAVDPIPMVQLIQLLGKEFVVWDRSAEIEFKRPANKDLYAISSYSPEEILKIKKKVQKERETDWIKTIALHDNEEERVYCLVHKTLYIADKSYYKEKRAKRAS